jgi:ABC-type Mn2+/Zn2+ transport system ATPase subunit
MLDIYQSENTYYVDRSMKDLWAYLSYIEDNPQWSIVDYTLYSTVFLNSHPISDEIDLFTRSQKKLNNIVDDISARWNLNSFSCQKYYTLSGGIKKMLVLALQIESIKENNKVIVFNLHEQLDKQNTQFAFSKIWLQKPLQVFISDDQPEQLFAKLNSTLITISQCELIDQWRT